MFQALHTGPVYFQLMLWNVGSEWMEVEGWAAESRVLILDIFCTLDLAKPHPLGTGLRIMLWDMIAPLSIHLKQSSQWPHGRSARTSLKSTIDVTRPIWAPVIICIGLASWGGGGLDMVCNVVTVYLWQEFISLNHKPSVGTDIFWRDLHLSMPPAHQTLFRAKWTLLS